MPIAETLMVYSILSGIFSISLFLVGMFVEKNRRKSTILLIWSIVFLYSSFMVTEYAFWIEGYNLFDMILSFNYPLTIFFVSFYAFLIWVFESRKQRKIWIIILILSIIGLIIAVNCMDCVRLNF